MSKPLLAGVLLALLATSHAQSVAPPPTQPLRPGRTNEFEIVGDSLVSAQQVSSSRRSRPYPVLTPHTVACQLFLGTPKTVFIVDKAENNPAQVNGHPAWASGTHLTCPIVLSLISSRIVLLAYDVDSNRARTMDIITNSFCAVRILVSMQ